MKVVRGIFLYSFAVLVAGLLADRTVRGQEDARATARSVTDVRIQLGADDQNASTVGTSNIRYHLFLANTPAAAGFPRDFPRNSITALLNTEPSSAFNSPSLPSVYHEDRSESTVAQSTFFFYPEDVTKTSATGRTILSAKHHPIFINCAASCWGNPTAFLNDLDKSNFIHLVDQYVGSATNNRYTLGTIFMTTITIFPGSSGVPTISESDILGIVHSAAKNSLGGTGLNHLYHVFIPPGVDTCMDEGPCYSPNNPATMVFCGYHFAVTFTDIGRVYYTVEPFQNVSACAEPSSPPPPNGVLTDSTDSALSHEIFESITDPDITTGFRAHNTAPPVFGQEIGDLCVGPHFVFTIGTKTYEVQLEYSDFYHACASGP